MEAPAFNGAFEQDLEMAVTQVMASMPQDYGGREIATSTITLDQPRQEVRFDWRDGVRAAADAQVIGVYLEPNAAHGNATWQWAWSRSLFQPQMLAHAQTLRGYGAQNGVDEIAALELEAPVERIWAYAMLAAALSGAVGVVGVKSGEAMILATIGPLRAA